MTVFRVGLILLVAAGLVSVAEAGRLGLGSLAMPGSGAWPLLVGLALLTATIPLWRQAEPSVAPDQKIKAVLPIPGAVLVFALAYPLGGLLIAAVGSAFLASRVFPGAGRRWIAPAAALAAVAIWAVLNFELEIPIRLLPFGLGA